MTGIDPASTFRGRYSTRRQAFDAVEAYAGTRSLRGLVVRITGQFAMAEVPAACAQRGDLVLIKRLSGYSLGLVAMNGADVLVARQCGLERTPLSTVMIASCFRV